MDKIKKTYNSGHVAEIVLSATVTAACVNLVLGKDMTPSLQDVQDVLNDLLSSNYGGDKAKLVESEDSKNRYELNLKVKKNDSEVYIKTTVDIGEKSVPVILNLKDYSSGDSTISAAIAGGFKFVKNEEQYLTSTIESIRSHDDAKGYIDILCDGLTNGSNAKADLIIRPYVHDKSNDSMIEEKPLKKSVSVKLGTVKQIAQFAGSIDSEPLNKLGEAFEVGNLHQKIENTGDRMTYLKEIVSSSYKELVEKFNSYDEKDKIIKLDNALKIFITGKKDSDEQFSLLFLGDKTFKSIDFTKLSDDIENVHMKLIEDPVRARNSILDFGDKSFNGYVGAFRFVTPDKKDVRLFIGVPKIRITVEVGGKWLEILTIRTKTEFSSSKRMKEVKDDGNLVADNGSYIIPAGSTEFIPIIRNLIEVGKDFKKIF